MSRTHWKREQRLREKAHHRRIVGQRRSGRKKQLILNSSRPSLETIERAIAMLEAEGHGVEKVKGEPLFQTEDIARMCDRLEAAGISLEPRTEGEILRRAAAGGVSS